MRLFFAQVFSNVRLDSAWESTMNGIESLLLNGAQQQHHYYSNNGGAVSKEMGSFDYHSGASSEVQNRTQFEADKQAVYR